MERIHILSILMLILVSTSVVAFDLRTIFNPFTQKLDYISVYNMSFNSSVADDRYLKLTGGNVTGNINMSGKNITYIDNLLIVDPSQVQNLERTDIAALHIRTRENNEVGIITSWTPMDWAVPWKENLQIGHVNVTDRTYYERIRMDTKGWLGVLTKSPKDQLDVAGTIRANKTNSTYLVSNNVTITKGKLYIDEDGILIEQDPSIPGRLNFHGTSAFSIRGFSEILLQHMTRPNIELWGSGIRTLIIENSAPDGKANLEVQNNITAENFKGNINASYIQNAPWITSYIDTYNTSADILAVTGGVNTFNTSADILAVTGGINTYNTSAEMTSAVSSTYVPYTGATTDVNLAGQDITNIGILGVGTTAQTFPAEIVASSGTALALRTHSINPGTEAILRMTTSTANDPAHHRGEIRVNRTAGSGATDMNFYVSDGGAMQRRVQIDSTGNVGIGVSDPTYKLQVDGSIFGTSITGTSVIATDVSCTACIDTSNIVDSYVRNTGDTITGNLGLGFDPSTYRLYVSGTSFFSSTLSVASGVLAMGVTGVDHVSSTDWNDFKITGSQTNRVYTIDASALAFGPFSASAYHDLLAFNRVSTPQVTRWNGTHWYADSSTSLVRNLFSQHKNQRINILRCDTTPTKTRWLWNSSSFSWSDIQWMVIGVNWNSPSPTRRYELQGSTNHGVTWTAIYHNSTSTGSAQPYYMKTSSASSITSLRLTISCVGTSGNFEGSTIKLLTKRWGDQGGGSEYEFPYVWNGERDMTFYGSAVFNENRLDKDFRIESSGDNNMFFVDAGNNRVGIRTSSPTTTLDVNGDLKSTSINSGGTIVNSSGIYFT